MSYNIVLLCGTVVAAVFVLMPIKELKGSYFTYGTLALCILVSAYAFKGAVPLLDYFLKLDNDEFSVYFKILMKVLGISAVCNITSDFAGELGLNGVSGKVEFAGKIAVMSVSIPLLEVLLEEVQSLL